MVTFSVMSREYLVRNLALLSEMVKYAEVGESGSQVSVGEGLIGVEGSDSMNLKSQSTYHQPRRQVQQPHTWKVPFQWHIPISIPPIFYEWKSHI